MRIRFTLLLLLAAPLLFAATTGKGDAPPLREFVVAYSPQKVNLDPLHTFTSMESQFFTAIYEGLVVANPLTLEPMPGVASSWDVSDDGTVYRFTLRPAAVYSNGVPVRAQDFVVEWLRMIDPAQSAEYSFLFDVIKGARAFRTGQEKDPSKVGIKAVSDSVLEVTLDKPAPHFLKMLTHISFLPVYPPLLKQQGWNDGTSVIGNGPFSISSRTDQEIILDKNPRYWDAKNLGLDRIRIRFMDDAGEASDGYITGRSRGPRSSSPTSSMPRTGSRPSRCSERPISSLPATRHRGAIRGCAEGLLSLCPGTRSAPRTTFFRRTASCPASPATPR